MESKFAKPNYIGYDITVDAMNQNNRDNSNNIVTSIKINRDNAANDK